MVLINVGVNVLARRDGDTNLERIVDPSSEMMRILDFNEWYMATYAMDYDKFLGEPTLFTKGTGKLWSSECGCANS